MVLLGRHGAGISGAVKRQSRTSNWSKKGRQSCDDTLEVTTA